jgi:hypothetical protein
MPYVCTVGSEQILQGVHDWRAYDRLLSNAEAVYIE